MSGSISTFVTRTALRRAAAAMAGLALLGAAAPATLAAGPGLGLLTTVDVSHPIALAADPSLDTVYVGQFGGGLVALSGSTGQSKHAPISLPGPLLSIAVNPATHTVYAADGDTANGSALSIIDGDDLSAAPMNVPVSCCPSAVAVNPVTNTVYLLNGGDQLSVLDGTTGRAIHAPISVGI
ncbi:MAG: hypothetical protein JO057_04090, partial [Chloroflexi bacterium]|nr:hypothetical protein [Chloroflexota bacterium]